MSTAVFSGSFDPVTCGHLDIIERASELFDRIIVAVGTNPAKSTFFSEEERIEMLKESVRHLSRVEVVPFEGALADFVRSSHADCIIRGLRNSADFEYELPMAQINLKLCPEAETVFLMTRPEHSFLSSSNVKEIASIGGSLEGYVPPVVIERFINRFKGECDE